MIASIFFILTVLPICLHRQDNKIYTNFFCPRCYNLVLDTGYMILDTG